MTPVVRDEVADGCERQGKEGRRDRTGEQPDSHELAQTGNDSTDSQHDDEHDACHRHHPYRPDPVCERPVRELEVP